MPTRYKYTLQHLGDDGEWITEEYKFYPKAEMDRIEAKGKIWKLAITKNKEQAEIKMKKITIEQVQFWLGSDCTRTEILEILAELANGEYDPKVLRTDILYTCVQ